MKFLRPLGLGGPWVSHPKIGKILKTPNYYQKLNKGLTSSQIVSLGPIKSKKIGPNVQCRTGMALKVSEMLSDFQK